LFENKFVIVILITDHSSVKKYQLHNLEKSLFEHKCVIVILITDGSSEKNY
jgi:hypothetical protein